MKLLWKTCLFFSCVSELCLATCFLHPNTIIKCDGNLDNLVSFVIGKMNYIHGEYQAIFEKVQSAIIIDPSSHFDNQPPIDNLFLHLIFKENQFDVIENGAFKFLPTVLTLDLTKNLIKSIIKETFEGLGSLKKLMLGYNKIEILESYLFNNTEELIVLNLERNQISQIQENAFAGLEQLSELNLANNKIEILKAHYFQGLAELIRLDIENNPIKILEPNSFIELTKLLLLDLTNSKIDHFRINSFGKLNKNIKLYFLPEPDIIVTYDPNVFDEISISQITFFFQNITVIHEFYGFDYSDQLKKLTLKAWSVQEIKPNAFGQLTQLEYFSILYANITTLRKNTFQYQRFLQHLHIAYTNLEIIESGAFNGLNYVKILNLENNKLKTISPGTFVPLLSVRTVYLPHNSVVLKNDTLVGLPHVTFLNLSYNSINSLNIDALSPINRLQVLSLASNNLTQLDVKKLKNTQRYLQYIIITENPWPCKILQSVIKDLKEYNIKNVFASETESCGGVKKLSCKGYVRCWKDESAEADNVTTENNDDTFRTTIIDSCRVDKHMDEKQKHEQELEFKFSLSCILPFFGLTVVFISMLMFIRRKHVARFESINLGLNRNVRFNFEG